MAERIVSDSRLGATEVGDQKNKEVFAGMDHSKTYKRRCEYGNVHHALLPGTCSTAVFPVDGGGGTMSGNQDQGE
jgi:hypothetical protein